MQIQARVPPFFFITPYSLTLTSPLSFSSLLLRHKTGKSVSARAMKELGLDIDRDLLEIPLPPGSVYYWSPEMNGSFPLAVLEFEGRLLLVFLEHQVFASLDSRSEQRVAEIRDIAFTTKVLHVLFLHIYVFSVHFYLPSLKFHISFYISMFL